MLRSNNHRYGRGHGPLDNNMQGAALWLSILGIILSIPFLWELAKILATMFLMPTYGQDLAYLAAYGIFVVVVMVSFFLGRASLSTGASVLALGIISKLPIF